MNVVFVSNYINHHQLPVSEHLFQKCREDGGSYTFIQTEPMEEERRNMGWGNDFIIPEFVKNTWECEAECQALINNADVVIFGGTEQVSLIEERLDKGKPVVQYSESVYKTGRWKFISPRGLKKKFHDHTRNNRKPVVLLCSGAYVAGDFRLFFAYPDKKYAYGYFPRFQSYELEDLWELKDRKNAGKGQEDSEKVRLLWAARMIDWKHPETAVTVAKGLKEAGATFELIMLGDGEKMPEVKALIKEYSLDNYVKTPGFTTPEVTRKYMEESDIYLATSDRQEGWGAVINEAMNSGMAVVANKGMGSAPFLIEDDKSGILYSGTNPAALYKKVLPLVENKDKRRKLGEQAYLRIKTLWNDAVAADRLYEVMKALHEKRDIPVYKEGPLKKL